MRDTEEEEEGAEEESHELEMKLGPERVQRLIQWFREQGMEPRAALNCCLNLVMHVHEGCGARGRAEIESALKQSLRLLEARRS